MKKLKLDKLEVELIWHIALHWGGASLHNQIDFDELAYLVIIEFLSRFSVRVRKKGLKKIKSATVRMSEAYALTYYLKNVGLTDSLMDITRNNLIEKLTKLYDGK